MTMACVSACSWPSARLNVDAPSVERSCVDGRQFGEVVSSKEPPKRMLFALVGSTATARSYQHCDPQKPEIAVAGSGADQLCPPSVERRRTPPAPVQPLASSVAARTVTTEPVLLIANFAFNSPSMFSVCV